MSHDAFSLVSSGSALEIRSIFNGLNPGQAVHRNACYEFTNLCTSHIIPAHARSVPYDRALDNAFFEEDNLNRYQSSPSSSSNARTLVRCCLCISCMATSRPAVVLRSADTMSQRGSHILLTYHACGGYHCRRRLQGLRSIASTERSRAELNMLDSLLDVSERWRLTFQRRLTEICIPSDGS